MKRKKKNSFVLLEVLLALTLLTTLLLPAIRSPMKALKKEKEELLTLYLEQQAENLFIDVEEALRTGSLPFSLIEESEHKEVFYVEKVLSLQSPNNKTTLPPVKVKIFLTKTTFSKNNQGTLFGKTQVLLRFFPLNAKQNAKPLRSIKGTFFVGKKHLTNTKTS